MNYENNFIQYVDESMTVKTKAVTLEWNETLWDRAYLVKGIETDFFVLALFVENKRVEGVEIVDHSNFFMTGVINDLNMVDLNTITKNHFITAQTDVSLYASPSGPNSVEISNFATYRPKPYRFVKKYKLPQIRFDNRFLSPNNASYDENVYNYLEVTCKQSSSDLYVSYMGMYKNSTYFSSIAYQGDSFNMYQSQSGFSNPFPIVANGSIFQFGDWYVKISSNTASYPYGTYVRIYQDVRTNEFWLYVLYQSAGNSVKGEFSMSTIVLINGGFKIKNIVNDIEVQITDIYG